jgi:hypothetical protein
MSDVRPHLVAVPDGAPEAGGANPSDAPTRDDRADRRQDREPRWVLWGVIVLLLVSVLALAAQTRRVGALEGRVAGLDAELAASKASLGAYQERFVEIRSSVSDLHERLGALGELVRRPPTSGSARSSDPATTR